MEANMTNARVLSGRGLVHRKLDKRQLACVAANAAEGQTRIDLSVAQLVAALNVSRPYIDLARSLPGEAPGDYRRPRRHVVRCPAQDTGTATARNTGVEAAGRRQWQVHR